MKDYKSKLRSEMKSKLNSMSKDEIVEKSNQIFESLSSLDIYKNSCKVAVYLSIESEVQTKAIIENLLLNGKRIFVPYIDGEMKFSEYKNGSDLVEGLYGIMEPKNKQEYKGDFDAIMVPGLAFDRFGNRLGRGKGYYDRFLKKCRAKRIGLAYEAQIIPKIPIEEHDVKMDVVISEHGMYEILSKEI